ncbi:MAG: glycosyltransferase [Chryseolinea sp.]
MKTIAAVVVTYNRLGLLKLCLECLQKQRRKLDAIIVVNNGSTDGTTDFLNCAREFKVIHQQNLGGAGGFVAGMKLAYDMGFDWLWLMDDDAFPTPECLYNLTQEDRLTSDAVLAPIVVEGNIIDHLHRGYIDLSRIQFPLQTLTSAKDLTSHGKNIDVSFVSFIGMLTPRAVISKVGFPLSCYFIFHDDVEYSIRIIRGGFRMHLVKNAFIYHKKLSTGEDVIKLQSALSERNPSLVRRSLSQIVQDKRDRYADNAAIDVLSFIGKRNWIRTVMIHRGLSISLARLIFVDLIKALSYLVLSRANGNKILRLYVYSLWQGVTGRFDNDVILALKSKAS